MKNFARRITAFLLLGLAAAACGSGAGWEGRYEGLRQDGPGGPVVLQLLPEGKGQWTAEQETTPMRWEARGGALWLHFKTGGVLVARPAGAENAFSLDVPGVGSYRLRKAAH